MERDGKKDTIIFMLRIFVFLQKSFKYENNRKGVLH